MFPQLFYYLFVNVCVRGYLSDEDGFRWGSFSFQSAAVESSCTIWRCVINEAIVCAREVIFYCLPRALCLFVESDIYWVDVTAYMERDVSGM